MALPVQAGIRGSYQALVGGGAHFAGVDQGIDFTGGPANIYALADGVVERVQASGSGWPGQGALVTYRLTSGPYAGNRIYIAEDFQPRVAALTNGRPTKVKQGQILGVASGSGQAPGIEVGWADANGSPVAPLQPGPHSPKPEGEAFNNIVQSLSAAGPGGGGGSFPGIGSIVAPIPGIGPVVAGIDAAGGVASTLDSVPKFLGFVTSWRFVEVVGGFFLLLVGLYLLGRQFGAAPSVPQIVTAAADATPEGKLASHADSHTPAVQEDLRPRPVYGKTRGRDTYGEVPF